MGDPEKSLESGESHELAEGNHRERSDKKKKKKKRKKPKQDPTSKPESISTTKENSSFKISNEPPANQAPLQPGSHPFEVDDSDHCETPLRAYQDLAVVLEQILKTSKKTRSSLRIYDPYYCDGGVKTKLASMGFTSVINENRDFYEDIRKKSVPDYDVLVTNPPYSGEHIEKLLDFCVAQHKNNNSKSSFLLLPHFVYTKDYYARALSPLPHSTRNSFFSFLVPSIRYSYVPPSWVAERKGAARCFLTGKDKTAPFPSFWYCCFMEENPKTKIPPSWFQTTFGASGSIKSQHRSGLRYAKNAVAIPRDFKGEFDPTKKRPNPRARKRMRLAAAAAANGGVVQQQQQKRKQQQQQRDPKKKKKKRY